MKIKRMIEDKVWDIVEWFRLKVLKQRKHISFMYSLNIDEELFRNLTNSEKLVCIGVTTYTT